MIHREVVVVVVVALEVVSALVVPPARRFALHDLEQHVTSSQQRSHFLRQVNGRLQTTQILLGKCSLATVLPFWFFIKTKAVE